MPDLLLELFSEEIPARLQGRASDDLKTRVTGALVDAGLVYEAARAFATPRRLALAVTGIPIRSPDLKDARKGPRVGSPEKAVEGFLRGAGLTSIDEARIVNDPKKGDFYVADITKPGRDATEIIAEVVPDIIRRFPWPASMRWGQASSPDAEGSESLRWIRPLQSVLCTFGPETEEPVVVDFEIGGLTAGNVTHGHRFLSPEPITVRRFDDYVARLEKAHVILDPQRRRDIIAQEARTLAFAQGLELVEDESLLTEVAGLVEWPVVLMGAFPPDFLTLPDEVIRATIRANQKCFVLDDPKTGRLSHHFILVANMIARDGGKEITAGNERVIAARLSDAKFFWDTDQAIPLEGFMPKFEEVVFHEKLGSQADRIRRIEVLARQLAPLVGADVEQVDTAARLAKLDLATEMVGEFPELQGTMGRYYAGIEGHDTAVCDAIRDHYLPQGPSDPVPTQPVAIAVALADKLDMLTGFWAIDEKPTGSKDPYALRRAALGVIRIVIENELRLRLSQRIAGTDLREGVSADLLAFFAERLKVQLREEGARHDLVDAVFALQEARSAAGATGTLGEQARSAGGATGTPGEQARSAAGATGTPGERARSAGGATGTQENQQDDLLMIVRRVEALAAFLDTDDGANLLAAYRRAVNILRIEEKKDGRAYDGAVDIALMKSDGIGEEDRLYQALSAAEGAVDASLRLEDFAGAMAALSKLRAPVDAFFDHVTVNAEDQRLRENRLNLLNQIRATMDRVAVFDRVAGG